MAHTQTICTHCMKVTHPVEARSSFGYEYGSERGVHVEVETVCPTCQDWGGLHETYNAEVALRYFRRFNQLPDEARL
jgi:hypothetical protein